MVESIRFRVEFGLRHDDAYVAAVLNDPTAADVPFGVPLLPSEIAMLQARVASAQEVAAVVREYGAKVPEVYAGVVIVPSTGSVVALFVGDLASPRAELWSKIRPGALLEIRSAPNTLAALTGLRDRVLQGEGWLQAVGARLQSVSIEVESNHVWLVVAATPQGGEAELLAHFAADASSMEVTVDPDNRPYLPRGSLHGQVVDKDGEPIFVGENLDVRVIGDIGEYEPDDPMGIATNVDGSFNVQRLAEMGWTVEIWRYETQELLGSAHVDVAGGAVAQVDVVADRAAFEAMSPSP